jgi:hypothetical protein
MVAPVSLGPRVVELFWEEDSDLLRWSVCEVRCAALRFAASRGVAPRRTEANDSSSLLAPGCASSTWSIPFFVVRFIRGRPTDEGTDKVRYLEKAIGI